ncbi:L(+)-tartrate dehydratase subunit beta [Secundilactobacillus hailunensis]|uniref:L(+)-tartrate dehydratase subunit beta n=1 Tax=Secundilactobacillus hailunensis TaxID=2559923 RepID=A0ABW1T865_9LACO|nr:L(+)-tartrate dehydratase subunit beta [Secundilactobacillus hailunensis]
MKTYHLTTPISDDDIKDIRVGDLVYLNGSMTCARDMVHRRFVEQHRPLPIDIANKAIMHAGPIVKDEGNGKYKMVAIGTSTSMRMEKFEEEFIKQSHVKLIIGKGGMGPGTERACKKYKALHLIYPAGNAVYGGLHVNEIVDAKWTDLGMPEAMWSCDVSDFGPLIVSIDTNGDNLFTKNKVIFNERKEAEIKKIQKQVKFIQ